MSVAVLLLVVVTVVTLDFLVPALLAIVVVVALRG